MNERMMYDILKTAGILKYKISIYLLTEYKENVLYYVILISWDSNSTEYETSFHLEEWQATVTSSKVRRYLLTVQTLQWIKGFDYFLNWGLRKIFEDHYGQKTFFQIS